VHGDAETRASIRLVVLARALFQLNFDEDNNATKMTPLIDGAFICLVTRMSTIEFTIC